MSKTSTAIWRCLLMIGGSNAGGSGADCKLGLIYCQRLRRSATLRTAAYHVGTRRRHLFLFNVFGEQSQRCNAAKSNDLLSVAGMQCDVLYSKSRHRCRQSSAADLRSCYTCTQQPNTQTCYQIYDT